MTARDTSATIPLESPSAVLILCREMPPIGGGAGAVALALAREYARQGYHIHYVTMHFGDLPEYEHIGPNIEVIRIRCGRKRQDSSYLLEMLRFVVAARTRLRDLCQKIQPVLIHAHAILPEGLLAISATRWSENATLIVTSHGSDVPGYNPDKFKLAHTVLKPLWNSIVSTCDILTAPSNHQANLIRSHRPAQKVQVIPNGVDARTFDGD